jgi:hypothetical protein
VVLDVSDISPDMLLGRQRAGAQGKDLWLVARASGSTALFPVIPTGLDPTLTALADLVAGKRPADDGTPALAFTNAIFVDVDGGGWHGPFAP